jgi:L-cysteine desulfidase
MNIESILHKTLKPALGCTEPVAISLGVAAAVMATEGWSPQNPHVPMKALAAEDVESVRIAMNKGVFKNALSGVICDGAKSGCTLKVSSSADMASRAASLAMKSMEVSDENGIVADTAENTIRNLKRLNQSMQAAEDKIIQIIQEKIAPAASSRQCAVSAPDEALNYRRGGSSRP